MTGPRYRKADGVHARRVDDETFLVRPRSDATFHLNGLGTAVWTLLADPVTVTEILDVLSAAFPDVAAETIRDDVDALLRRLVRNKLVEETG